MRRRIVVDTNVYVSRMLRADSVAGRALERVWSQEVALISPAALQELEHVLRRPKFARYIQPDSIDPFLHKVWEIALHIDITQPIRACRDPRDDLFLELAVSGQADALLTGDEDLLALHPFHGISILTPADFLVK